MSDILRVTTALVNQNQNVAAPQAPGAAGVFDLQDPSKVLQTHNQRELLEQNTGSLAGKNAPDILMDLIQDPSITASYLKNLSLIEEIYKLVPAHNTSLNSEIESLFDSLLVSPDNLSAEMMSQEAASTSFHGELFDLLRSVSYQNSSRTDVQFAIANYLKALYGQTHREDILTSLSNNLLFLKSHFSASLPLSQKFAKLAEALLHEGGSFSAVKNEIITALRQAQQNLLVTDKAKKIISIALYNLSRYDPDDQRIAEATVRLRKFLSPEQQGEFMKLSREFLQDKPAAQRSSNVMNALIRMLEQNAKDSSSVADEKLDTILSSLLASPCNFTPLLHYVIPVDYQGTRAFAEFWINPEPEENPSEQGSERTAAHFLIVLDVDGSGRYELELYVQSKEISLSLFCPKGETQKFQNISRILSNCTEGSDYHFKTIQVHSLSHPRSLMEVFKSLPYRRVGVDVKI